MQIQTKVNVMFIVIIFSFFGWHFIKSYQDKQELKKKGVYVIGMKFKFEKSGNRGGVSFFKYFIKGKSYEYSIRDGGTTKSLQFLIVLPYNPSVCRIIEDVDVPSCLTVKDVPEEGWKELPLKICK